MVQFSTSSTQEVTATVNTLVPPSDKVRVVLQFLHWEVSVTLVERSLAGDSRDGARGGATH